jgi:hypothetical protein
MAISCHAAQVCKQQDKGGQESSWLRLVTVMYLMQRQLRDLVHGLHMYVNIYMLFVGSQRSVVCRESTRGDLLHTGLQARNCHSVSKNNDNQTKHRTVVRHGAAAWLSLTRCPAPLQGLAPTLSTLNADGNR